MTTTRVVRRYELADYQGVLTFLGRTISEMGYSFEPDGKDADIRDIDRVYLQNRGSFHVVEDRGEIHGCVGVRKFSDEIGELKRLYLAAECRGLGLGRALCNSAIQDARDLGYKTLRLDTTTKSQRALALFRKLGFHEIARYNPNPDAEVFMEKTLCPPPPSEACPVAQGGPR
ncbi:MAG TPA: GNAT family N-acetyltransferase [Verrucomicrobiae bacterium]|nr:GNAT family N-acetyltransferase [Verrucomicrobiae bacterium]